jgi:uncharacterized protein
MDNNHPLFDKINPETGPKRILSLDGGGIRGIITLQFLKRIETLLRERHKNDKFVLADYFDFIGGTSTGSIIATALALGHDVDFIINKYEALATKIFPKNPLYKALNFVRFGVLFNKDNLLHELGEIFKEEKLGSDAIKTCLGIVAKRADRTSAWMFYNNPRQHYYGHNKDIFLKDAVRASSAAPIFFLPEKLKVKDATDKDPKQEYWFEDGGVSMHNNPALLLFLTATLRGDLTKDKKGEPKKGFGFNWQKGADKLMLVSVGTGFWRSERSESSLKSYNPFKKLKVLLGILMDDSSQFAEIILQMLAKNSPTARPIDSMYGHLLDETFVAEPMVHYLRYNLEIDGKVLLKDVNTPFSDKEIASLQDMTQSKNIKTLKDLSEKAAVAVQPAHFPDKFDKKK